MGTDTEFRRPDFWPGGPVQARVGRSKPAAAPGYGDRHDVRYADRERSTLNFQLGDRKGALWAEYGDRHRVSPTGPLTRRTCQSAGRAVEAGCGAWIWGQTRCLGAGRIEGQARCPIYRPGTFNLQRSTLNFQLGDRKGAWWAEYGDRHRVSATGPLTRRTCQSAGRAVEAGCGAQGGIWGQTQDFFW